MSVVYATLITNIEGAIHCQYMLGKCDSSGFEKNCGVECMLSLKQKGAETYTKIFWKSSKIPLFSNFVMLIFECIIHNGKNSIKLKTKAKSKYFTSRAQCLFIQRPLFILTLMAATVGTGATKHWQSCALLQNMCLECSIGTQIHW